MLANGWFFCQTQLFLSCGLSPLSPLPLPLSTTQLSNKCAETRVSAHCAGYAAHKCFLFALDLSKKETQNFFFICTNLFIQDMAND